MSKIAIAVAVSTLLSAAVAAQTGRQGAVDAAVVSNDASELVIAGDVRGDLSGYLTFQIERSGNQLTAGSWLWVNRQQNADGSVQDVGQLEGAIVGAQLTVDETGALTRVTGIQLRIDSGAGLFQDAASGTGSVEGTVSGTQFSATLKLPL